MTLVDGLIMWLHLICASIWVGGSIFLGIVLAPMLKTITKTIEERVSLMIKIGRRFNKNRNTVVGDLDNYRNI